MTDDAPVIFKRKQSKPSQSSRARPVENSVTPGPEDVATQESGDSPAAVASRLRKQQKARQKQKPQLSFGGDDEVGGDGEVIKIKKSNLSRKIALTKVGQSPATSSYDPLSSVNNSSLTPRYDASYLSELKASTPGSRPTTDNRTESYSIDDMMLVDDTTGKWHATLLLAAETTEIRLPTSSSIVAAKQKRKHLRKTGGEIGDDYISLSLTKRVDQGPHPESRLVREEDELGEADDEFAEYTSAQERIALGKKSRKAEAKKRREEIESLIADTLEDDEEEKEWEQEQIRRAGHRELTPETQISASQVYKPSPIPAMMPIPTLEPAIARLSQTLSNLTASHLTDVSTMTSATDELDQIEEKEKELREAIERTEAQRGWFAAFREFVEGIAHFLDEKYPALETLEEEHLSLLKEKFDIVAGRRKAEDEDDLSLLLGHIPQPASEEPPKSSRQERSALRLIRRAHRHQVGAALAAEEGFSTDSSLSSDQADDFQLAIAKLKEKAEGVLNDVRAGEFRDPPQGLGKWFGEWKEKYEDIYVGAWGGLGLVGAWEFWARLEIVGWNPFQDQRSFDSFDWYNGLYQYSMTNENAGQAEGNTTSSAEGDLASSMVSTAVVPRLCKIIEGGGFNPYSMKDVRTAADLVEQVEIAVRDTANLKFQMLLKSVLVVFQSAVDAEEQLIGPYLKVNQPRFDPEAIPARERYLNRRVKLVQTLLRWRKRSGQGSGVESLVKRVVDVVIVPVADGGWGVGGEECLRKVMEMLPPELVTPILRSRLSR
ncbi:hypothetical protein BDM02DRAFT_3094186 [Thelephora ganbajun]|uniref:Uncharacterized protein n=1 Tax=Thelephora ganbajun TaxID=370292 RepID=A0ACB6ZJ03_THEGA|nr:hypothetical protein BDM02DRAFT_3094186 [Thelephora ganbajun]